LTHIEAASSEAAAFSGLVKFASAIGGDLISYHHLDPASTQEKATGDKEFSLFSHGFPDEWVKTYRSTNYHLIDPITAYAAYQTRPVLWSDVPRRVNLTGEQKAYIDHLYRWLSPGDGFAIPLFGPSGRHGYGSLGWRTPIPSWDDVTQRIIQSVFESFHLRICELRLTALHHKVNLNKKQIEVLRNIRLGLTDAMICERLNIRSEELKILIRRIMAKMDVSDRPSAILRAEALGLFES
jgi:DNA-binding CsgD family transcriptional regulator